jgi:hypothetical protein
VDGVLVVNEVVDLAKSSKRDARRELSSEDLTQHFHTRVACF